ncbi:MAG: glycosyltransferase family 4 protein [Thermoleophilia bacterium]|nr:glycosyltransferase family 4 protein [Thermoleophilia bacterium]MDH4345450.1 glycosyltransferase family 4 protein [Thermoleophilia bacterium]MDH5332933.1 glycosyltransferase family 4 protein [Thermoleophilia bacterium]
MKGLRLAYVLRVFPKLSETFIVGELAELRRRDVDVRILSLDRPQESLRHRAVAEAGLDSLTTFEIDRFAEELGRFRPTVVHAHFATEPTAFARGIAAARGVPFTFTAHGYDVYRRPPADFHARARDAAGVVTVSEANARHIRDAFGVPSERLRVIPCGIDLARFSPGCSPDPRLVLAVARLNPVKRLDVLLDACAILRDRGVSFRCVVIGDGPCRAELEQQLRALALDRHVTLAGAREQTEVAAWWKRAGIAVLSSEREGMPVCLMEAAASGVPAVAPAVGGIPELVEDGVTGLLVREGDPVALAGALARLLRDPAHARELGRAARTRAEHRFSVSTQVDGLVGLWQEVLAA